MYNIEESEHKLWHIQVDNRNWKQQQPVKKKF